MPSFDVVSELDKHEVTNAVENAVKELDRRYDLKGKGNFARSDDFTARVTACGDTPRRVAASLKLRDSAAVQKMRSISRRLSIGYS